MLRVGLLGLGNVGAAVVALMRAHEADLAQRAVAIEGMRVTGDAWEVVRDPEVDVLVELIGGIEPARASLVEAMRLGKSVVTANKQLMAAAAASCSRRRRTSASPSSLKAASPAGSRSFSRSRRRFPATPSSSLPASSTGRRTTSSRGWPKRVCRSRRR
ncbi:MAG: hypothetical protein FJX78_05295 [Armatimonadetes bacterium]|nr:hypothetical protein [Armatimonadota bacterium]